MKWITLNIESDRFDFDIDVLVDVVEHEPIKVDVGVGDGLVVDTGGIEFNVIKVEMEGKPMPPSFIKLVEDSIEYEDIYDF